MKKQAFFLFQVLCLVWLFFNFNLTFAEVDINHDENGAIEYPESISTDTGKPEYSDKVTQEVKTLKILTVGNSYARNAIQYLPQIAASVPGYSIIVTQANIGGTSMEDHVNLIDGCDTITGEKPYDKTYCLKDLLKKDSYDFVTIQQKSVLSFKIESFQPYMEQLCQFIKEHASGAEIVMHQTWAYSSDCSRLKDWGISKEEMHIGLVKAYNTVVQQYNMRLLPSGSAFYRSFSKRPDIDLWLKDRYHANVNGCYLAGCVWFSSLTGVSPKKVSFIPEGMDVETAVFLRKIAAKEVKKRKRKI